MLTKTAPLKLEAIAKQFAKWRANKQGNIKIPDILWKQIAELLKHHGPGLNLKCLGITTNQLRRKGLLPSAPKRSRAKKSVDRFVEIPIPPALMTHERNAATLNFKRGELHLSLECPSQEQVQLFINALRYADGGAFAFGLASVAKAAIVR